MQVIIFTLIVILSVSYLFVRTTNKAQSIKKDGTTRNVFAETLSISFKLLFVIIVVTAGYFIWNFYDERQSKKITGSNISAKWRSDEVILKINKDNTFQYNAYAGANKGKNWKGVWKLDGGVLFLNFGDSTNTNNYRIVSLDKNDLELELKVKDTKGIERQSSLYFDKVE